MAFSSAFATIDVERRRRLRLVSFLVRMWLWKACLRLMRPLPVFRKRLAAPRLDFILGMCNSLFERSQFSSLPSLQRRRALRSDALRPVGPALLTCPRAAVRLVSTASPQV